MTLSSQKLGLFFTAFLQVFLVAANTVFISKGFVFLMLVTGFGISLVWTLNVRRAVIATWTDRIIYSSGAMFGTGLGYYFSQFLITII